MKRLLTALTATAMVSLTLVGLDTMAYAATGDSLILGKLNQANKTTTIKKNGLGPALKLQTKPSAPPLAVNSSRKVAKLNADHVDGKSAADLQGRSIVYSQDTGTFAGGFASFDLPNVPDTGTWSVDWAVYMQGASGSPASPTDAYCYLDASGTRYAAYSSTSSTGGSIGLDGSDVFRPAGDSWSLLCAAFKSGVGGDSWTVFDGLPVRVTLTRIDSVVRRTADASRVAGRVAPALP